MVDWLAETLPGKAAARKLNEKIETVEQERNALAEERAVLRSRLAAGDLTGVTAESVAGHLARFGDYFDRFNAGQRKELVEAVVRAVTVEGPARARVRFSLPTEPLGRFDQSLEGGSKYRVRWWPQRDETPNGIPAEFVIVLDSDGPSAWRRGRKPAASGRRKRSKE